MKLCENTKDGHHGVYLETLLKIKDNKEILTNYNIERDVRNIVIYLKTRYKLLDKYLKTKDSIHLLYLDAFYTLPVIKKIKKKKNNRNFTFCTRK